MLHWCEQCKEPKIKIELSIPKGTKPYTGISAKLRETLPESYTHVRIHIECNNCKVANVYDIPKRVWDTKSHYILLDQAIQTFHLDRKEGKI